MEVEERVRVFRKMPDFDINSIGICVSSSISAEINYFLL